MSTFAHAPATDRERRIEGAIVVLGAFLREEHPADAFGYLAKLAAEARITCDPTMLGQERDTDFVRDALAGCLQQSTDSSWHLPGHDGLVSVLESVEDDSEVLG